MKLLNTANTYAKKIGQIVPVWATPLLLRISIFFVFWNSVQTKISGLTIGGQHFAFWNVTDTTILLFEYDYALPLIPAEIAAYLATFGEFFLSLGILFGLLTRFSALGLLIMTLVIQIFVYPNAWALHLMWGSVLLYLVKEGPDVISLDHFLRN